MSHADTAEYQLNRLVEAMNDAVTEASGDTIRWQSKAYRDGWVPANHGTGKRIWFLIRDSESVPIEDRYYCGPAGRLVRYASYETAKRAADKLNR